MGISKSLSSWIIQGVEATNGCIMTFWNTNFNMPVPYLFDGSYDCSSGFMSARYGDMASTTQSLAAMRPGYEVALSDAVYRWCVCGGDCLNGITSLRIRWIRGATCMSCYYTNVCININSTPGYYTWTMWETMANQGIAGWEICSNEMYGTEVEAACVSGDDTSIGGTSTGVTFCCVPSTGLCSSTLRGSIWVDGCDLHYINANCWEHWMVGNCTGSGGEPGAIYIDDILHYLHWVGCDGSVFSAKWRICQFCSSFSNGAPANPAPGVFYAGNIWMDAQFGLTHLAYIGSDGNKYLTGAGNYPYVAP